MSPNWPWIRCRRPGKRAARLAPRAIASGSRSIAHTVQGAASQERRRVAAAAERAVQIDAAVARGEQADDLGQHDGDMGVMGWLIARPFPGRVKPCVACPLARLGAAALGRRRLPDLEDTAETHEHHGLGKSGIGDEGIWQNDATFLVRLDRKCIRIQRGS